jgi:hypothetical protein
MDKVFYLHYWTRNTQGTEVWHHHGPLATLEMAQEGESELNEFSDVWDTMIAEVPATLKGTDLEQYLLNPPTSCDMDEMDRYYHG